MRLAVTGTPGTGKSTLCAALAAQQPVVSVQALAEAAGLVVGHDAADDAAVIDMEALAASELPGAVVIDGHLSHLLPVDEVWVIRLDPTLLRGRLEARGYAPAKVRENLEAEAMDLILQEALASGARVVQRDGSRRSPEALMSSFMQVGPDPLKSHDLEPVDWSDQLPIW